MIGRTEFFGALVAVVVLRAGAARADSGNSDAGLRLPVPEAARPLTLPRLVLAPEGSFEVDRLPGGSDYGELDLSVAAGLTDDLGVHALVAPLQLWSPPGDGGAQYGETNRNFGPSAGVVYRFLRGPLEIAGDLTAHVYTIPSVSGAWVTASVPLRLHLTHMARLDVAPAVTLQFASFTAPPKGSDDATRISVPVTLLGNVTRSLDIGLTTGLTIYQTSDWRDTTGIPLGVVLGYAVPGPHGPLVDINPFFDFPYFVLPAKVSGVSDTGQYQIGVNVTAYLYL